MSGPDYRHVPRRELARLRDTGVEESSVAVSFVRTDDDWQLAISHYRNNRQWPATRRHPVLLCHGLGANRLAWDVDRGHSLPQWLVNQGYDVYAVELRGHGLSERPGSTSGKRHDWGFAEYCTRDLPAALDFVLTHTQRQQLHLLGHSMGGILLYCRAALADTRIRSGIAIGSSLDYSGLPTLFHRLVPFTALTHLLPAVPLDLPARFSGWASAYSTKLIDPTLVNPDNVDPAVYRKMASNILHPVSGRVLRDLREIIAGRGLPSAGGESYDALLQANGYPFPVLAISGEADIQCPPATAARFGTQHRAFGRRHGQRHDYGHHDLLMGLHAEEEVWPVIGDWLAGRD
ncbi:MAG: alpha/beta fold hydrolase [Pseudomonadota bacterium]